MYPHEKLFASGMDLVVQLKFAEAIPKFEAVLETHPDYHMARSNMGLCIARLEKFDEALECFDHILKKDPKFSMAYGHKILVLDDMGRKEEADRLYDKLYEMDSEHPFCLRNEGLIALKEGREKDADKLFSKLLDKAPEWQEDVKSYIDEYVGESVHAAGKCRFCRKEKPVKTYQMRYGQVKYCDKCVRILGLTGTV